MITIRQSLLYDYEQCPYMCYDIWGKFGDPDPVQEEDEVSNKYAMAGTAFHSVMDAWAKCAIAREPFYIEDAMELLKHEYAKIPDRVFDSEEDRDERFDSLIEQLKWVWDKHLTGVPFVSEKEFLLEDLIPGLPPIQGTIDRIDASPGFMELYGMDYKTGKVFTKKELASSMQATIYSLAIERLYGKKPKRFTFVFTRFKKRKDIYITDHFIDMGTERIKSIWYHILNEDFNPPYKPNKFFCKNFCESRLRCPRYTRKPPVGWEEVDYA